MMPVTAEQVAAELKTMEGVEDPPDGPDCWDAPVWYAGEWLGRRLGELGADDAQKRSVCFALGQRIRMRGIDQAYAVAAECFNRWVVGQVDGPGLEFGIALSRGSIDA